jgi:hypothetical protein
MEKNKKIIDDRIFFLDLLKAISIATVVLFHASSNLSVATKYQLDILQSPLRFCVPVLLTISFFLLSFNIENNLQNNLFLYFKRRLFRLLIPILFWFCLANLINLFLNTIDKQEIDLKSILLLNIQGQIFWGAYFLLILLQFSPIVFVNKRYLHLFKNILVAFFLQSAIFVLCFLIFFRQLGREVIVILCSLSRPVFFYWFIYLFLGDFFQKNWTFLLETSQRFSNKIKIFLIILTSFLMISENTYFHHSIRENCFFDNFEYLKFSCIASVFVAFCCCASISEDTIPLLARRVVHLLSKYSLGIFCINGILSKFLLPKVIPHLTSTPIVDLDTALVVKIVVWPLLLIISLSLSLVLEKIGLRKCVC